VLAGVGVAPRVELAVGAGLAVDDGVLVDEAQVTSHAAVLAAGDVARPRDGFRVEHWHAAREAGERAAASILGAGAAPRRAPWVFSEFAGASLDVFGLPAADSGRGHEPVEHRRDGRLLAVAYLRHGTLEALSVVDGSLPAEEARTLVDRRASAAELATALGSP
jgi:3-phenylpropionate/trans-cinnamate dioxygenase ferredoxin reductase subunit